ncbi:MAG TPA: methyltransferase domain-containing protein [Draconibacterium sp.]|nr:methyltransferase domain-containing protein [Draconibacterium sp.]
MNNFWDDRFGTKDYAYGTEPNKFFKEQLKTLKPGNILLPAEGEGRNAVYAASVGWQVTAFDQSIEGKRKAELLALKKGVSFDYRIEDYELMDYPRESFDCVALIFAHMNPVKREVYHKKLISFLKPGGILILEGFSKNQIHNKTGGPRDIDMLFSEKEMNTDFASCSKLSISETETELNEGPFHQGMASVIHVFGIK